jgi:hypothetical protein
VHSSRAKKLKVEPSGARKTHQNLIEAKENQSGGKTERTGPGHRQWRQDQKQRKPKSLKHKANRSNPKHEQRREPNNTTQDPKMNFSLKFKLDL